MKISMSYPVQHTNIRDMMEFGRFALRLPGTRLWSGQSVGLDAHQAMSYLAGAGIRPSFGLGVALTPLVHPAEAAVQARSLAALSGQEFMAGFGTGGNEFAQSLTGREFRKPALHVDEYLRIARAALSGDSFEFTGEHFTVGGGWFPKFETPPVRLGAGVVRPYMARVAGRVADFVVTWLTPPSYVEREIDPALRRGAQEAERERPQLVAILHVGIVRDRQSAAELVRVANDEHLGAPHYRDMLDRAGVIGAGVSDLDKVTYAVAESDAVAVGTLDDIVATVDRLREAGADEVVLHPSGVYMTAGAKAALRDLDEILSRLL